MLVEKTFKVRRMKIWPTMTSMRMDEQNMVRQRQEVPGIANWRKKLIGMIIQEQTTLDGVQKTPL